ncbi:MAG: hypothetical protein JNN17_21865 [Verrucomicrobiaceae bacterium]|nr:hypothetical protein [Verrucomicrobiaceae bacterium]
MGFNLGASKLSTAILAALSGPPHLFSLEQSAETQTKFKLTGVYQHKILPVNVDILHLVPGGHQRPFVVIISNEDTDEQVADAIGKLPYPALHITHSQALQIVRDRRLADSILRQHAREVARWLRDQGCHELEEIVLKALAASPPTVSSRSLDLHDRDHGTTRSNEFVLKALGASLRSHLPLIAADEVPYVLAINHSANALIQERRRLCDELAPGFSGPTCDAILACPGLLSHLWSSARIRRQAKRSADNHDVSESFLGTDDEIRRVLAFCVRQEGYSVRSTRDEIEELRQVPAFNFLMSQWKHEIDTFVACLTAQASNEVCPVVRLPRDINRLRGSLKELGKRMRSSGGSVMAAQRIASSVVAVLTKSIIPHFGHLLGGHDRQLRVVADVPVEWVRVGGVPLMLRHSVSRVPATPGNLMSMQSLAADLDFIDLNKVTTIPIIRSFRSKDPLKHVLEASLAEYARQEGWILETKIIDVSSEAEFIAACDQIDSPILVFDGHGAHDELSQIATLKIGDDDLDVWSLRGRVELPPIVILSSCDACAADRSHASTSNGFMAIGATTVLGPVMPVHGIKSGIMVARLLYRMTSVVRSQLERAKVPMSWARIVTDLLRTSYIAELTIQMIEAKLLIEEQGFAIAEEATHAVNTSNPAWFEVLKRRVCQAANWSDTQFDNYLGTKFVLPDALLYLQVGHPEKLMFVAHEGDLHPSAG